jgi:hypothetical protein
VTDDPRDPKKRLNLHELMDAEQDALRAVLGGTRRATKHPEGKGTATELRWKEMLESFLPTRYCVSKASVLDADGYASDQFDAVVHDRHFTPTFRNDGGSLYIPAESVYGVVEVKQELSRKNVKYAIEKVASVRHLRRTSVDAPLVEAREPASILGAIVCLDSAWSKDPLGKKLEEALALADEYGRLDLGCSLLHGSFEVTYAEDGTVEVTRSESEIALSFFSMRLFARLRALGSVAPLDADEWSRRSL